MNFKEACEILGIDKSASKDDIKKAYKALSKKYHPDICKDPDAESRFKDINKAYKIASDGEINETDFGPNFSSDFSPFVRRRQNFYQPDNIKLQTTISFKESVMGCKKEIKFVRKIKCHECNGIGEVKIHNNCTKCNGRGQITGKQGNMIFIRTCDGCHGHSLTIACSSCKTSGLLDADVSISVSVPGGVQNQNILRLNGMGNFAGNFGIIDQYTDAHLHINVISEEGLSLYENDVISHLDISLLEALRGCEKNINTIMGYQKIMIKPLSKNNDEVIIPKLGVNQVGNQKVILNVSYPDNVESLIKILSEDIKDN